MQRLLDLAQLCVYLVGILVMLWVGHHITSNQIRLGREMDRNAMVSDQMWQDHVRQLQDHERRMQRLTP